jgi:hypothetical protein
VARRGSRSDRGAVRERCGLLLASFRPPQEAREYVAWAFADQASAECRFGEPIVDGERAAVEWWGAITTRSGEVETIPGVSLLRFDDQGLVVEQRDVWASHVGTEAIALPRWAPQV